MTQTDLKEVSVASGVYEPDLVVLDPKIENAPASLVHTYHPTHWLFINHLLDITDSITRGRAGQLQRLVSFLFVGGLASLVNLGVFYVVYYGGDTLMSNPHIRYAIASVLAAEISIIANFSLNDYFTFRHMPGHGRSWKARCVRFHMTAISGVLLTALINFALTYGLHMQPVRAQAIAIVLVLFYNFAAHNLFTYRHVKTTVVATN